MPVRGEAVFEAFFAMGAGCYALPLVFCFFKSA
jgi:hypothetical protein